MTNHECTEEQFLRDIAKHEMTILNEDGVYRRIRFAQPDSSAMSFELITWPGHLCYTGDMGTFVFERTNDMFSFFRGSKKEGNPGLQINTGYWGEKCIAVDSVDGIRQYSPDSFREVIQEELDEWLEDLDPEEDAECIAALKEAVQDELLCYADDGEQKAREAADEFEFSFGDLQLSISDFFERTLTVKSFRFVWCCYAIVWAIAKYDQAQKEQVTV